MLLSLPASSMNREKPAAIVIFQGSTRYYASTWIRPARMVRMPLHMLSNSRRIGKYMAGGWATITIIPASNIAAPMGEPWQLPQAGVALPMMVNIWAGTIGCRMRALPAMPFIVLRFMMPRTLAIPLMMTSWMRQFPGPGLVAQEVLLKVSAPMMGYIPRTVFRAT